MRRPARWRGPTTPYDRDGELLHDDDYFTGTARDKTTLNHVKGLRVIGSTLHVGGMIWSEAPFFVGRCGARSGPSGSSRRSVSAGS